jgi:hypothetical protein
LKLCAFARKIVFRRAPSGWMNLGCFVAAKKRQGLRLADRDLKSLKFVVRHGFATAGQIGLYAFSDWVLASGSWGSR